MYMHERHANLSLTLRFPLETCTPTLRSEQYIEKWRKQIIVYHCEEWTSPLLASGSLQVTNVVPSSANVSRLLTRIEKNKFNTMHRFCCFITKRLFCLYPFYKIGKWQPLLCNIVLANVQFNKSRSRVMIEYNMLHCDCVTRNKVAIYHAYLGLLVVV